MAPKFLDRYYILAHTRPPRITVNTFSRTGVPRKLMKVVVSSDSPYASELASWCRAEGLPRPLRFDREKYFHDPYLSLMPREMVEKHWPETATPARRFISSYEYRNGPGRYYAVLDDDVSMHWSNPWRAATSDDKMFDSGVWQRAIDALQLPQIWSCCFINPYTWGPSYKDGVVAQTENLSLFHRKGQSGQQSAWVLSSGEEHMWFSPIVEDYITTARYAAMGRFSYCLNEYINVADANVEGIWATDDPKSRSNKAGQVAALRLFGSAWANTGSKPYRKRIRYAYPHIITQGDN